MKYIKKFLKWIFLTKSRHEGAFESKEDRMYRMMNEINQISDESLKKGLNNLMKLINKKSKQK